MLPNYFIGKWRIFDILVSDTSSVSSVWYIDAHLHCSKHIWKTLHYIPLFFPGTSLYNRLKKPGTYGPIWLASSDSDKELCITTVIYNQWNMSFYFEATLCFIVCLFSTGCLPVQVYENHICTSGHLYTQGAYHFTATGKMWEYLTDNNINHKWQEIPSPLCMMINWHF